MYESLLGRAAERRNTATSARGKMECDRTWYEDAIEMRENPRPACFHDRSHFMQGLRMEDSSVRSNASYSIIYPLHITMPVSL